MSGRREVLPAPSALLQMVKHVDHVSYPARLLLDLRGEVYTRHGHHLRDKIDKTTANESGPTTPSQ